jgi:hypothetical protein
MAEANIERDIGIHLPFLQTRSALFLLDQLTASPRSWDPKMESTLKTYDSFQIKLQSHFLTIASPEVEKAVNSSSHSY